MSRSSISYISFAVLLGTVACGGERESNGERGDDSSLAAQQALVSDAPPLPKQTRFRRHRAIASEDFQAPITPYDLRDKQDKAAVEEQERIVAANIANSGWGPQPDDSIRLIHTDEVGDEWEQEIKLEDLRSLHAFAAARGINRPSGLVDGMQEGGDATPPGVTPQGWSGGNDARFRKPINGTYPINHNVLMRQGKFNIGCTAALVGRRMIVTAAHCVVDTNGNVYYPWYRAHQDATTTPYDSFKTDMSWRNAGYTLNNCHTTYTAATRETCNQYDWVVFRLRDNGTYPLWNGANGAPGWMGYWIPATSGWFARIDGYPACGYVQSPANCVDEAVYGENVGHSTFNWRGYVSGEATTYNTANDMSPGNSGGPVVSSNHPDTNGPYVLGVVTNEMCAKCQDPGEGTPDDRTYPTMVFAMTSWVAGVIDDGRVNYP